MKKWNESRIQKLLLLLLVCQLNLNAQNSKIIWSKTDDTYYTIDENNIFNHKLPSEKKEVFLSKSSLTPTGEKEALNVSLFSVSTDMQKVLLFTNTKKVWRLKTRGDYWIADKENNSLKKLGASLPEASLMFAKLSPDGRTAAYVSGNNIYTEELSISKITPLTTSGTTTLINGTFDWAYEEEFFCRDGFRWSPDSRKIAYWQINAGSIRKFYMINNTDSVYSRPVPLEYPKAGEDPSLCRVGIADLSTGKTEWINVPGDPVQHYIVRMEFIPGSDNILIQQLNRKQNISRLYLYNGADKSVKTIYEESDDAWVDIFQSGNPYTTDFTNNFTWLENGKAILWATEKDGWRHLYIVKLDGSVERNITPGDYDVIEVNKIDEKNGFVYFMASPDNATQKYLYRTSLKGNEKLQRVTPLQLPGTHDYSMSHSGKFAFHSYSSVSVSPGTELVTLPDHKALNKSESIEARLPSLKVETSTKFFQVTTVDNVVMDGWISYPVNFDSTKKYPVVFYVYTEPASATVTDSYGDDINSLYLGDMSKDGYIYISLDNRGTPAPKGREWRKSIYKNIGIINIRDQAMAAKEILKWPFVDPDRIAVWGWSGGGSATLNLMFQHPDIYKTGIAIAALGNLLTYDNIYQERYTGLPQEDIEPYIQGSAVTHAKNLKGNLLYIHGTGDDNVHYQNAEMLVNELIKYNKNFQFMPYPNRTHSISEGEGTSLHLVNLYTSYLRKYCPPGPR